MFIPESRLGFSLVVEYPTLNQVDGDGRGSLTDSFSIVNGHCFWRGPRWERSSEVTITVVLR